MFRHLGRNKFKLVEEPATAMALKTTEPSTINGARFLLDDSIQLVSLFGPAGTGKTFLALLAGMHKVLVEDQY